MIVVETYLEGRESLDSYQRADLENVSTTVPEECRSWILSLQYETIKEK